VPCCRQSNRRRHAYSGDSDHGDGIGVEGVVPVGGAAKHDRLELGDACGGVDVGLITHVKLVPTSARSYVTCCGPPTPL